MNLEWFAPTFNWDESLFSGTRAAVLAGVGETYKPNRHTNQNRLWLEMEDEIMAEKSLYKIAVDNMPNQEIPTFRVKGFSTN